ncbi:hypothetical protein N9D08_01220 [bacterium]|nr:hypothetical protein [bacterium]
MTLCDAPIARSRDDRTRAAHSSAPSSATLTHERTEDFTPRESTRRTTLDDAHRRGDD